jgi:hypothetical protein
VYTNGVSENDLQVLRNHVVIDPTLRHHESAFKLRSGWKRQELIQLACLSYLIGTEDEFLAWEIRKSIGEAIEKFSFEDRLIFENLIYHRNIDSFIEFLIDTNIWHSSEFFGFFSKKELKRLTHKLVFSIRRADLTVVYAQRKRGYNDKGSRTEDHNRRNVGDDYTFNEEYEAITSRRFVYESTRDLIRGLLGQW